MSLVTNANRPSSNVAIRLEKLQNLYQVLKKNEPNQDISKAFTNLEKIDRHVIRTSSCETIGCKHIVNKIVMRNAVERHMETLKKAEQVFQTGIVKDQTKSQGGLTNSSKQLSKNPLLNLTQNVLAGNVLPFLTIEERTNLQTACVGYSSLTASRFHRLNKLSQAIVEDQAKIPVLFRELHKDDRTRILKKFQKETFDWNQMEEHKEPLLKEIEVMKAEHSFTIPSSKSLVNYLKKLPIPLMSASLGSFLTEKERGNFRSSCRDTRKIQPSASSIIKTYHLENLIETYLHVSSSNLTTSDKAKTLHKLMSLAYSLSKIEELSRPTYLSLPAFFQEVEARNLIRLIGAIHNARLLPQLPAEIQDLHIPKDSANAMQKAGLLRDWIHQHQGTIAAIDGDLYLENKDLSLLPKEIGQLQALQRLYLKNNRLLSVPKEIGQLKALKLLLLENNHLVDIPKEIGQLQALQWLLLEDNCLVSIPKEIGQLHALKLLLLENNHLVDIPKELSQLKALQWLYLANNRLVSVPKEIGQLKALNHLHLEHNQLVSLPKEIDQLQALKVLYLHYNRLVSVPKEIGQLKALNHLHLHHNRLVGIPKEIGQLPALQRLHLENNHLVSVPKEIGRLRALLALILTNNQLVSVPKEIGRLKALQSLFLSHNCLVSVPKEIGQLQALLQLNLENNRLVSVPKEIGQLQPLLTLRLGNNGLISLPPELDRFRGAHGEQNKQLQVKNFLRQLSFCVTGQHNTKKIASLLKAMENLLGKETRSQLHRCLYEVAREAAKDDKILHKKLKDKQFGKKAFLDESINPKLKAAAIANLIALYTRQNL